MTKTVKMVDVSEKHPTLRKAIARAELEMNPKTLEMIKDHKLPKGDVLTVAKIAGIHAAKDTPRIIPLCHHIPLSKVEIEIEVKDPRWIVIESEVLAEAKTGVEMEALVATSIAALTIYDMCKMIDKGITIKEISLIRKTGGKSGDFIKDVSDILKEDKED